MDTKSLPSTGKLNRSGRQFGGPTEKRQHYIGRFVAQIAESDPDNRHFSKTELAEAQSTLRKEVTTNPMLFKLIQEIVDKCTFLDDPILEMFTFAETNGAAIPQIDDRKIEPLRETIDEQEHLQRLAQFNAVQISNRAETPKKMRRSNTKKCDNTTEDLAKSISVERTSQIGARLSHDISNIAIDFRQFNIAIEQFESHSSFARRLFDIDEMVFDRLARSADLGAINTDQQRLLRKYICLERMYAKLAAILRDFETRINSHLTWRKVEYDLVQICAMLDRCYRDVTISTTTTSAATIPTTVKEENVCDEHEDGEDENKQKFDVIKYLREAFPRLSVDHISPILYRMQNNIFLLHDELRKKKRTKTSRDDKDGVNGNHDDDDDGDDGDDDDGTRDQKEEL